jgi:single-stranded DNA-specific DHH superfamily exonuclease
MEAARIAVLLDKLNRERKAIETQMLEEAVVRVEQLIPDVRRHSLLTRLHFACREFSVDALLSAKLLILMALPTGVEPVFSD